MCVGVWGGQCICASVSTIEKTVPLNNSLDMITTRAYHGVSVSTEFTTRGLFEVRRRLYVRPCCRGARDDSQRSGRPFPVFHHVYLHNPLLYGSWNTLVSPRGFPSLHFTLFGNRGTLGWKACRIRGSPPSPSPSPSPRWSIQRCTVVGVLSCVPMHQMRLLGMST